MSHYLEGKTVLVFGASQGIGLATAKKFGELGARVFLAARSINTIKKHADILIKKGISATALHCDITRYESVAECVKTVLATDSLDFVVNSAGTIDPLAHLIDSDPDLWANAVDVNLKGTYHVIRACAPHMRVQGGGTIINLSSGAANSILEGWSHYCSTKAAAKKLTEVAHKELNEYKVRIIGLSPGTVATEMMKKIRDAKINVVSNLDWSTHISPESVALGIVYLCGPEGDNYSGTDFSLKTEEGRRLVGLE